MGRKHAFNGGAITMHGLQKGVGKSGIEKDNLSSHIFGSGLFYVIHIIDHIKRRREPFRRRGHGTSQGQYRKRLTACPSGDQIAALLLPPYPVRYLYRLQVNLVKTQLTHGFFRPAHGAVRPR